MPQPGELNDILAVLIAAIVFVALFQRLRISPVLAYLAAGVAIGPYGAALIHDIETTHFLAEFGVIFLLFTIGLELPFERVKALRAYIFGLGLAQVFATSVLIGLAAWALGASPEAALVIGGALALSSTATVLQLLVERGEAAARHGRIAISVLLFQDLAVVPLLVLIPLLASPGGSIIEALLIAGVKAMVVLAGILVLGRFVIRPIYRVVAATGNAELFFATSLLVVLGTGYATAQAGMSMALGAFLAGLMLAECEYRHQIEADIQPFRGLFLGLFFISVGMTIDLSVLGESLLIVIALAITLLAGKTLIFIALTRAFGLERALGLRVSLLLAQGGEFAFVILGLAQLEGVVSGAWAQPVIVAVGISMAVTPLLAWAGMRLQERLEVLGAPTGDLEKEAGKLQKHVMIAGFGRVGETIAMMLAEKGIPYLALDVDVHRVRAARRRGMPVFYGDASRLEVLKAAGLDHASAVALTLDRPGNAERAVRLIRSNFPKIQIFARGRDLAHRQLLREAGADSVVPEAVEASLQLAGSVLRSLGTSGDEIEDLLDRLREEDYAEVHGALDARSNNHGLDPAHPGAMSRLKQLWSSTRAWSARRSRD